MDQRRWQERPEGRGDFNHRVHAGAVLVRSLGEPKIRAEASVQRHQITPDDRASLPGDADHLLEVVLGSELWVEV
jgi:hypothetical protein